MRETDRHDSNRELKRLFTQLGTTVDKTARVRLFEAIAEEVATLRARHSDSSVIRWARAVQVTPPLVDSAAVITGRNEGGGTWRTWSSERTET